MATADIIKRIPEAHRKTIETYSVLIARDTKANNEAYRNEDAKRLRGYLTCMKDAGMITESELRALYLYYFTNGDKIEQQQK